MNLDFDLFISGSPNGDQRWPNNSEDMFCKQFFALETDTSNECDFFIEVRTSPEGQRCCYYSYVHRKDVFGLVNGNKRKGAYFALILRFKGIFCNTPRNIYFLMDMVYRNKIEGSIIEKTSTGESYLVESFASKNDKLREIENLFASQLAVIVNNLKPLDSSFASSQSGKIISYNLYEKDDATIMDTLRKHLKVHLLAFTNDQSGIIEGFKTQLLSKDKTFNELNTKYANLLKEKQGIESSFNEYKNKAEARYQGYQQRIAALEQEKQSLLGQIDKLRAQLQEAGQLPKLHEWILEYARKNGGNEASSHHGVSFGSVDNRERREELVDKRSLDYYIHKYWPYLAALIIVVLVILLVIKLFVPGKPGGMTSEERQQYELQINTLSSRNEELGIKVEDLKDSLTNATEMLNGIKDAVGGGNKSSIIVPYSRLRVDVTQLNGTPNYNIVPSISPDLVSWKIIEGSNLATKEGSYKLSGKKSGKIKIVLVTSGGEELSNTVREVNVNLQ